MDTANMTAAPAWQPVKLDFMDVFQNGIQTGIKNIASLLGAVVLWVVTLWIPYINVGTTIALLTIPVALSKGEMISPFFIFDKKYRQFMGEFFLTLGFMNMSILPALMFMIVPGIILQLAWSQALFLVLDKGLNPAEAMTQSNKLMAGNKWIVLGLNVALFVAFFIVNWILCRIWGMLGIFAFIAFVSASLGIAGVVYGRLTGVTAETPPLPPSPVTVE